MGNPNRHSPHQCPKRTHRSPFDTHHVTGNIASAPMLEPRAGQSQESGREKSNLGNPVLERVRSSNPHTPPSARFTPRRYSVRTATPRARSMWLREIFTIPRWAG